MSDPYTDQAKVLAALSAENGMLRADNERLRKEIDEIIGMCLGNVGIREIHAKAVRALEPKP